jgi:hypothetical protein
VMAPLPVQNPVTRWTAQKALDWYAAEPFLFGANYNPANTINELEFWQADTFDPAVIDRELGWAESLGINTLRVFLHDLPYQQDAPGFLDRIDQFLSLCQKHNIRPMLVLFDSCWDPNPRLGKQHEPVPGVHNSGWVQSPGAEALTDVSQYPRLEAYVKGVVGRFSNDSRVLLWDIWNEPDNTNDSSYGKHRKDGPSLEPANKVAIVNRLLPLAFGWAREAGASQPLTSGVWIYSASHDWSKPEQWSLTEKIQFAESDVITFHQYSDVSALEHVIPILKGMGRPVICTEFMARGANSKFQTHLPVAKREKVGMVCWGFVAGRSQTYLPWDSWANAYANGRQPAVWFHEILRADGSPYDPAEVAVIRQVMEKKQ